MGRAIRKVPKDWEHPKKNGRYIPKHTSKISFLEMLEKWLEKAKAWEKGEHPDQQLGEIAHSVGAISGGSSFCHYWEWDEHVPDPDYYMPYWADEERTHYQMYETTTEGTPITPVLSTQEEVARWCADNEASVFAKDLATYEQWLWIAYNEVE